MNYQVKMLTKAVHAQKIWMTIGIKILSQVVDFFVYYQSN